MPTGYTSTITGKTTLAEFAMTCARAFGACVTMREDPAEAVIPDEFKPDDYYAKATEDTKARVAALKQMSDADKCASADVHYAKQLQARKRAEAEHIAKKHDYDRMMSLVLGWKPPTEDHQGMKTFMIEQIQSSIEFDCFTREQLDRCYPVKRLTGAQWYTAELESAKDSLKYSEKHHAEECARAEQRSKWVRDLRNSLK